MTQRHSRFTVRGSAMRSAPRAVRSICAACTLGAAIILSGCTSLAPGPAQSRQSSVGQTRILLPTPAWEDLGLADVAGAFAQPTRALALRAANREPLALLLVQPHAAGEHNAWTGNCPAQQGLLVEDATAASPVRIDCLRLKRWASQTGWITRHHPALARWMAAHQAEPAQPYAHLHYRYATQAGAAIEIHAIVDQRLLRPRTHGNDDFLRAGQPAQAWSRQLAQAARASTALTHGLLVVPPFPFALPD